MIRGGMIGGEKAARLIKGSRVFVEAPLEVCLKDTPDRSPHQPEVRVHRSGDRVDHIEVMCSCGERILITLEYSSGS